METIVIVTLCLLLIATNCFWAYVSHRFINKMMSRTYWEYQNAKVVPEQKKQDLAEAIKDVKLSKGSNELDSLDELIKTVMPLG